MNNCKPKVKENYALELKCPLCKQLATSELWHSYKHKPMQGRPYYRCANCKLIYVPENFHLRPEDEKKVYLQHENDPTSVGYRTFLEQLRRPMMQQLSLLSQPADTLSGLDFGSGPGPTLSLMFAEAGYKCANYDPYFAPDDKLLAQTYNFIVSSEVFEHLSQPALELDQLVSLLKPKGLLGIMTQRPTSQAAFQNWHYLADPTHITFYSAETFTWLAQQWRLEVIHVAKSVVILQKL